MVVNEIRTLRADEIECRVQSVSKTSGGKVGAVMLLYKDARCDMRILDETFGMFGWKRSHELINGNLFCTISIRDDNTGEWVDKQDVGVESNTEKEKGQASDAFKRAGFNVGIGRELYTAPFIWIELNESEYYETQQNGKTVIRVKPFVKFNVISINYSADRVITGLTITDKNGVIRYTMGQPETAKAEPEKPENKEVVCPICGRVVKGIKINGEAIFPEDVIKQFGKCGVCIKREQAEAHDKDQV